MFLEAFSNLVTTHTFGQYDWLARTGSYSIHALLARIAPEVHTETADFAYTFTKLNLSVKRVFGCLGISNRKGTRIMLG
jgi:formamidopyrimidine-DNA glycosylase